MAITPTSTKSKQYQALGIDEIANDIETVFTAVNDLETTVGNLETEVNNLPASPTTTVVNISSAQILNMGSSPIELLPAPGVGKYYSEVLLFLEYNYNSLDYSIANGKKLQAYFDGAGAAAIFGEFAISYGENCFSFNSLPQDGAIGLNLPILLGVESNTNPTGGNGTLRAIITYTERTFGA